MKIPGATSNDPSQSALTARQPVDKPEEFFAHPRLYKTQKAKRKQALIISDLTKWKRLKAADEKDHHVLYFFTGLVLSLILIITAFEWKFYDNSDQVDFGSISSDRFEDLLDIPLTEQVPPPPVKDQQVVITVVDDEVEIDEVALNLDVEITEDMSIQDPVELLMDENLPEEEAEEIFVIVETRPEPVGGMDVFYEYLSTNIKYPNEARQLGISGRVYVQFVVEKDGSFTEVQVVKGIGGGCDEEALRVLLNAPPWKPGKQRGKPVRVKLTIPIFFTLAY